MTNYDLADLPPDDTTRVATPVASRTDTWRLLVGFLISAIAAAVWCIYVVANGTSEFGDSQSYLSYADALVGGRIPSSERTPGYPIFILFCRVLASVAHIECATMIGLVQVALLAAVSTYFVYDLTYRLAGRVPVAAGAAFLFAGDADVQAFAAAILTEALATTLAIAVIWARIRDGDWRRAAWIVGLLVITRPIFVFIPALFAMIEAVRLRSLRAGMHAAGPAALALVLWILLSTIAKTDPSMLLSTFGPRHSFGKVYEFELWRALPDSPERQLIEAEHRAGHDVYHAFARLSAEYGTDGVYRVAWEAYRAAPIGLTLGTLRALPRLFRQPMLWRPSHENEWVFGIVVTWHRWYRIFLYWPLPLLGLFLGLMVGLTANGLGYPAARVSFLHVITPFVCGLFVTVALLAMGTDEAGRLAMAFRPFYCVAVTLGLGALVRAVRRWGKLSHSAAQDRPSAPR